MQVAPGSLELVRTRTFRLAPPTPPHRRFRNENRLAVFHTQSMGGLVPPPQIGELDLSDDEELETGREPGSRNAMRDTRHTRHEEAGEMDNR